MGGSVFLALPLCVLIGVTADRLVPVLLGPGWEAAIPLLQLLSIAGAIQVGSSGVATIYLAAGRPDLLFRWGVISAAVPSRCSWSAFSGAHSVSQPRTPLQCACSFIPCYAMAFPMHRSAGPRCA